MADPDAEQEAVREVVAQRRVRRGGLARLVGPHVQDPGGRDQRGRRLEHRADVVDVGRPADPPRAVTEVLGDLGGLAGKLLAEWPVGDWQRDDGESEDTFLILPDEEEEPASPPVPSDRRRNTRRAATVAAGVAAVVLGFALSYDNGDGTQKQKQKQTAAQSQTQDQVQRQAQPQTPRVEPPQTPQTPQGTPTPGFGGADLTGAAADKAAKAALTQFPGSIERVTSGPSGGYIVHVIQPEAGEVHVVVSDDFKVLGSDSGRGGGGVPGPNSDPGNPS